MARARQPKPDRKQALVWWKEFKENVQAHLTAHAGWKKIRQAGLEEAALRLLWQYTHLDRLEQQRRELKRQAALGKAVLRAWRVARERPPRFEPPQPGQKGPPLLLPRCVPTLFDRRLDEKVAKLKAWTGWDADPLAQIVALRAFASDYGPLRPFLYLFFLRELAARRGVRLGIKRLSDLAVCANPHHSADPSDIARYFRQLRRWGIRA
jgi:hypothetical protein